VVMGYPAISPDEYIVKNSQDVFNRNPQMIKVPTVTVTNGNISKVIRKSDKINSNQYFSTIGDVYQLTINATGGGNSGGPMFDADGNVIGIFFAGIYYNGTKISFAVPIKYGIELMGTKKIL
ncbi:MAG TPA: trypsin-like serine protease, partial [Bacteroidetes bacterium]|nr:trypsin-like serine protease [Bacteroidota bacterium]